MGDNPLAKVSPWVMARIIPSPDGADTRGIFMAPPAFRMAHRSACFATRCRHPLPAQPGLCYPSALDR